MPLIKDPGRPLVVATYNIHSCVGIDHRYDPDRIAAVLRELDADIVALQEVSARDRKGTLIDEFAYLAKATGCKAVPGPSLVDRRGVFGNVVLTRWPVLRRRRIDLSVAGREPRGALDVDVEVRGRRVRVVAAHFGLRLWERRLQAARLRQALAERHHEHENGMRVLLGDLNEWRRRGGGLGPVEEVFGPAPPVATFPSGCPVLPLDRIYASRSELSVEQQVHRSGLARLASDHLPLRATIA